MKIKSLLPNYLAFFVRISIYALFIYIVYILLLLWSHTLTGVMGAAAILFLPIFLCVLILHLGAYLANSGVLYVLLAIIYGFHLISSLLSLAGGDIDIRGFVPMFVFIFYDLAFIFVFTYSAYYLFALKYKSSVQRRNAA